MRSMIFCENSEALAFSPNTIQTQNFFRRVWPAARQARRQNGVTHDVLILNELGRARNTV